MAVDTRDKRMTIMSLRLPWRRPRFNPDGTIGAADRLAFLRLYSGIAVSSLTSDVFPIYYQSTGLPVHYLTATRIVGY